MFGESSRQDKNIEEVEEEKDNNDNNGPRNWVCLKGKQGRYVSGDWDDGKRCCKEDKKCKVVYDLFEKIFFMCTWKMVLKWEKIFKGDLTSR